MPDDRPPLAPPISRQLRDAIRSSGRTYYDLGHHAQVDPSLVSRFVRGRRGLTTKSLDAIAGELGLRLVPVEAPPNTPN